MSKILQENPEKLSYKTQMIALYISTFLLRTGFGGSILLFDWTLVWAIENSLGVDQTASASAILLISFSAITYYIAEILLTGYYGSRSDRIGPKPIILMATIFSGVILLLYAPTPIIFAKLIPNVTPWLALFLMTLYLAAIHFLHGVFASAKVAPSLGFINQFSTKENRALHMAWYDNAILYGRAAGILLGGFLWIILGIDSVKNDVPEQASRIALTFPFLSILLVIAVLLIIFGLEPIETPKEPRKFSLKEDISIAANVMLDEKRRPLLLPWISIAALLGSASLWGPTVSFILSSESSSHRGFDALLPLLVILVSLALPAPLWGIVSDRKGRKFTLLVGLFGLPIMGILGLAIGYPFYRHDLSISNIYLLLSLVPAAMVFSSLIPVLMGALGDTAEEAHDGEVMSGYHFVIASGEIVGVLIGGIVIGLFSFLQSQTGIFGVGQEGTGFAILIGFVLFEMTLVLGMIWGILKLPDDN